MYSRLFYNEFNKENKESNAGMQGGKIMYEIGFMLPIIIIIAVVVILAKEGSEQARHDREIDKLIEENSKKSKEYYSKTYGKDFKK